MTTMSKQTKQINESNIFKHNEAFVRITNDYLAANKQLESASEALQTAANWYKDNNVDIGANAGKKYPLRLHLVDTLEQSGIKRTTARNYVSSLYSYFKNPKATIFDLNVSRMMALQPAAWPKATKPAKGTKQSTSDAPAAAGTSKSKAKTIKPKGINNLNEALIYIAQQNKTILNSIAKFENEIDKLNPDILANLRYLAAMD